MLDKRAISLYEFLPDYFQLDLDDHTRACVDTLDGILQGFASSQLKEAASQGLLGTSRSRLREGLASLGFHASTLNEAELIQFSRERHRILASAGSLKGVGRLLDVYFPGASVQKGRPYPRTKLSASRGFRLSDRRDRRQVVGILLPVTPDTDRLQEFLQNCRLLVSFEIQIEVRFADAEPTQTNEAWKLSGKTKGGRLACRTSLK